MLAAIGSFAEIPERVMNTFVNKSVNDNGIYAMNFYRLGVPNTVVIDDYLALVDGQDRTLYANLSEDNGLWGPFIEKGFAKFYGNFQHIIGGNPNDAVEILNGSPTAKYYHTHKYNDKRADEVVVPMEDRLSAEEVFEKMSKADPKNAIMTAVTEISGSDEHTLPNGINKSHAYSVLRAFELKSTGDKLVEIRNPWGKGLYEDDNGYIGKWHDNDERWTEALKKEANYDPKNEGIFMMDYKEFHESFTEVMINPSTLYWHQDYFLKLGDTKNENGRTKHTVTIENAHKDKQAVHFGAHTYQDYGYGKSSSCNYADSKHTVCLGSTCEEFKYGARWLPT